ncbi:unnamed protein product [Trichobilharzia regenti]|nr:unnamed protein product [Trichobilharzia regenti]
MSNSFRSHFPTLLKSQYTDKWTEKSLIKDLLRDYEKRARPVVDGMSPEVTVGDTTVQQITVAFGLGLIQILELDENEQILTVSVRSLYVSCNENFILLNSPKKNSYLM